MVRSTASIALHVLRVLEDALIKSAEHDMIVNTRTAVALYILNQKRAHLRDLEQRFGASLTIAADDGLTGDELSCAGTRRVRRRGPKRCPPKRRTQRHARRRSARGFLSRSRAETSKKRMPEAEAAGDEEARDGGAEPAAIAKARPKAGKGADAGADVAAAAIAKAPESRANAPQPPDDALEAMAQIGGLRRSVALESEAETGQAPFPGTDEAEASHRDGRRRSRRGERAPGETSGNLTAGPADAAQLEFKPEPAALGGGVGEEGAGRARRGRRAPRAGRGREAAVAPNAASAFAMDDGQVRAPEGAAQGDDVGASPASAKADAERRPNPRHRTWMQRRDGRKFRPD